MREVHWRMERISDRQSIQFEFDAVLHDKKIKQRVKKAVSKMSMSEEKELLIERAQEAAKKRVQGKNYGK